MKPKAPPYIPLSPDVHAAIKERAAQDRRSLQATIDLLLREALGMNRKPAEAMK